MAYARSAVAPRDFVSTPTTTSPPRPRFWRKVLVAMRAARQRQAEREIALYLHSIGGKFTDEAEREIERRFLSSR